MMGLFCFGCIGYAYLCLYILFRNIVVSILSAFLPYHEQNYQGAYCTFNQWLDFRA